MTISMNPKSEIRNPKLLFIHGWATDSSVWKYQLKEFSKKYEVIVTDLPGHGGNAEWGEPTLKPAVEKVLSLITHDSPSLFSSPSRGGRIGGGVIGIGWSLGGQALLETAVKTPDVFKGLVLIGTAPKFIADETFPYGQPQGVAKRMLKDIKKDFSRTMKRFYPLNFTEDELSRPEAQWFTGFYKKPHAKPFRDSAVTALEALLAIDLRDIISDIKIPVLIIHGEKDNVCPVGTGKYLARNLPEARLEIFKGAGHAPFLTRQKEFNQIVKRFIEKL